MKTIWKWTLGPETKIDMPTGAQLLAVQMQHGDPQLWALVDPKVQTCQRIFKVHPTGEAMKDDPGRYVGTVQMQGGHMVFHVFEVPNA